MKSYQESEKHLTPIELFMKEHSIGKSSKNHSMKIKIYQFPLKLSWAMTAHKIQGQSISPPSTVVTDFDTFWQAGQAYVVLSRIRNLEQLFITNFMPEKIWTNNDAESETLRLIEHSTNPFQELESEDDAKK